MRRAVGAGLESHEGRPPCIYWAELSALMRLIVFLTRWFFRV